MIAVFRAMLFYAGATGACVMTWIAMVVCHPFSRSARHRLLVNVARFILFWLKVTCGVDHRVEGFERVPPEPVVLLSKHQSSWETMALITLLPKQSFVLKRELLETPVLGFGLRGMHPISIDRGRARDALRRVIDEGCRRLADGWYVTIFPEGTRVPRGRFVAYRKSGAQLAKAAGVPVVPVAHNSGDHWPHGRFAKRPGTIRLVFGEPIDSSHASAGEITAQVQDWIEGQMHTP